MSSLKGPEAINKQTENYVRMLYRYPSPALNGRKHTPKEIAEVLHLPLGIVKSILGIQDPHHPPLPQVRHGQVPDNERAFFLGLAILGRFQIDPVQRGRERFVVVATESTDALKKGVLTQTIGKWGEVHQMSDEVKVYLGSPTFDFMMAPSVNGEFLGAKTKYAPFLCGGFTRLSDRENRLSCSKEDLLRRIHRRFSDHFNFSMGHFSVEHRIRRSGVGEISTPVITVRDPGRVIAALMGVRTVTALPFLRDLNTLSEEVNPRVL